MKKFFEDHEFETDALYDEFLEIIVNGGSFQGIADCLAQKLCVSILIENEFFHVRARSVYDTPVFSSIKKKSGMKYWKPQRVDPSLIEYVSLLQATHQPVVLPELPEYGVTSPRMVFPVIVKDKITNYLNIFKEDLTWDHERVVRAALHSLVVLEIYRQAQVDSEDRNLKNLIFGIMAKDHCEDNNYYEDNNFLVSDISVEAVLAVIQIKDALGKRQMEEALRSVISDLHIHGSAIAINDEQAVFLLQSSDAGPLATTVVTESLQELFEALKITFKNHKVKIGVGRQCFKTRDYKFALNEAFKAQSFASHRSEGEEGVIYYHSLNLMECLIQPGNEQMLSAFVEKILGKLYAYGASNNINLIDTLECYLNHNCCIQSAAKELFIHPNSLRYRLEKMKNVSGLDLTDNDTRLEVQLAIKLYRYRGEFLDTSRL